MLRFTREILKIRFPERYEEALQANPFSERQHQPAGSVDSYDVHETDLLRNHYICDFVLCNCHPGVYIKLTRASRSN